MSEYSQVAESVGGEGVTYELGDEYGNSTEVPNIEERLPINQSSNESVNTVDSGNRTLRWLAETNAGKPTYESVRMIGQLISEYNRLPFRNRPDRETLRGIRKLGSLSAQYAPWFTSINGNLEYDRVYRQSLDLYGHRTRPGLGAIILPHGHGKTTMAREFGWIDIDSLYDTSLSDGSMERLIKAYQVSPMQVMEERGKMYESCNRTLDLMPLGSRCIILVHDELTAIALGATVLGGAILKEEVYLKAMEKSGRGSSSIGWYDWYKCVANNTKEDLWECNNYREIIDHCFDLCNANFIPVGCPRKYGTMELNEDLYSPEISERLMKGEFCEADEILDHIDKGLIHTEMITYQARKYYDGIFYGIGVSHDEVARTLRHRGTQANRIRIRSDQNKNVIGLSDLEAKFPDIGLLKEVKEILTAHDEAPAWFRTHIISWWGSYRTNFDNSEFLFNLIKMVPFKEWYSTFHSYGKIMLRYKVVNGAHISEGIRKAVYDLRLLACSDAIGLMTCLGDWYREVSNYKGDLGHILRKYVPESIDTRRAFKNIEWMSSVFNDATGIANEMIIDSKYEVLNLGEKVHKALMPLGSDRDNRSLLVKSYIISALLRNLENPEVYTLDHYQWHELNTVFATARAYTSGILGISQVDRLRSREVVNLGCALSRIPNSGRLLDSINKCITFYGMDVTQQRDKLMRVGYDNGKIIVLNKKAVVKWLLEHEVPSEHWYGYRIGEITSTMAGWLSKDSLVLTMLGLVDVESVISEGSRPTISIPYLSWHLERMVELGADRYFAEGLAEIAGSKVGCLLEAEEMTIVCHGQISDGGCGIGDKDNKIYSIEWTNEGIRRVREVGHISNFNRTLVPEYELEDMYGSYDEETENINLEYVTKGITYGSGLALSAAVNYAVVRNDDAGVTLSVCAASSL